MPENKDQKVTAKSIVNDAIEIQDALLDTFFKDVARIVDSTDSESHEKLRKLRGATRLLDAAAIDIARLVLTATEKIEEGDGGAYWKGVMEKFHKIRDKRIFDELVRDLENQ